jgi:hypothetical protein
MMMMMMMMNVVIVSVYRTSFAVHVSAPLLLVERCRISVIKGSYSQASNLTPQEYEVFCVSNTAFCEMFYFIPSIILYIPRCAQFHVYS